MKRYLSPARRRYARKQKREYRQQQEITFATLLGMEFKDLPGTGGLKIAAAHPNLPGVYLMPVSPNNPWAVARQYLDALGLVVTRDGILKEKVR